MDQYQKQAKEFLIATNTTLTVEKADPQKVAIWAMGEKPDHKHINYTVTLKNSKHTYTFDYWGSIADYEKIELAKEAKERGIHSAHYYEIIKWCNEQASQTVPTVLKSGHTTGLNNERLARVWLGNVVETVEILITPTAYDILSSMSPMYEDNFKDWCDSLGYDTDSIQAEKIYKACLEQDHNLRRLFTHEDLEQLAEIN
jgi:hypothetical protein